MAKPNLMNGMLLGAGLMYLYDPDRGRRRRALLRDQAVHLLNQLNSGLDTAVRDLRHRSYGVVAGTSSRIFAADADDSVLEARVRSRLGRVVSHPGSIQVLAEGGRITLSGPILASEHEALLSAVQSVSGVHELLDRLEVHQEPGDVPGLQGEGRRPGRRLDVLQHNWAPATRLLATAAGSVLALYGVRARGLSGATLSSLGLGLIARGLTNLEASRLVGAGAGRRVIDIHKAINVNAPVEEVFDFWSRFDNFPRFMSHLREVRHTGEGESHWVAAGPGGVPIEWDASVTQWLPNELIAWKSVEGSTVGNAGVVRFQPNEKGGTRVDIRMTYNPPAGAIGHAVAAFFGVDPKHAMDEDLVRFKSLIEHGKTSADGGEVRREEVGAVPQRRF